LHNILPDDIAARLKANTSMIAESFESASVLFADVVDFTPMSAGMSAAELVALLNRIFTTFDAFVEELGLEKIKPSETSTWSRPACPCRGGTTPRLSPTWR
jgi:adenylate cyclase